MMFLYTPAPYYNWNTCPNCGGNGVSGGFSCYPCRGTGLVSPRPYPQIWPPTPPHNPPWVPQCTCGSNYTAVCPVHPTNTY